MEPDRRNVPAVSVILHTGIHTFLQLQEGHVCFLCLSGVWVATVLWQVHHLDVVDCLVILQTVIVFSRSEQN